MTTKVPAYAATAAKSPLAPFAVERREPGEHDVLIDILFCGVCHSDIHQVRDEWGGALFPMVPGHEIVGRVTRVGAGVTRFKVGDLAGVGCMVDSCRELRPVPPATSSSSASKGAAFTYNGTEMDRKTPTYGGYSTQVVVRRALRAQGPGRASTRPARRRSCAPASPRTRRCASGTARPATGSASSGLGGLGHMAVKLAAVDGRGGHLLSTSPPQGGGRAPARRAARSRSRRTTATFEKLAGRFDLIIDTISAPHDYNAYLGLLRPERHDGGRRRPARADAGRRVLLDRREQDGSPARSSAASPRRRRCSTTAATHGIVSDVEVIPIQKINEAYERMLKGDVRYRFVIDIASLKAS